MDDFHVFKIVQVVPNPATHHNYQAFNNCMIVTVDLEIGMVNIKFDEI